MRILEEAGCRPWGLGDKPGPNTYHTRPNYDYEPEDYELADLFRLTPDASLHHTRGRSSEGCLRIHRRSTTGKGDLVGSSTGNPLVSESLKQEMESQNFRGLAFRPTIVVTGESWEELEQIPWSRARRSPLWELTSTVMLPHVSPRCKLLDEDGKPIIDDDWSHGLFLVEDVHPAGELHYLRQHIDQLEPFDFALTYEPFRISHRPNEYNRELVMSRRAYDFFRAKKHRIYWRPVYIDE